jgi:hypothetical protein
MNYLLCAKCGVNQPLPKHCGKPMKIQEVGGKYRLVCWMGTGCGVQDLPEHCEVTMGIAKDDSE